MRLSWQKNRITFSLAPPPPGFVGRFYHKDPSVNWGPYIPMTSTNINYLEIGCADGGNAIIISNTYAANPNSKLYCVDPWMDYDEYPEYKGEQEKGWETFNLNIQKLADHKKFVIKRGMSDDIVPTFANNFFDLIFIE